MGRLSCIAAETRMAIIGIYHIQLDLFINAKMHIAIRGPCSQVLRSLFEGKNVFRLQWYCRSYISTSELADWGIRGNSGVL